MKNDVISKVTLSLLPAFLAGCGSTSQLDMKSNIGAHDIAKYSARQLAPYDFRQIKAGMSKSEVLTILGRPNVHNLYETEYRYVAYIKPHLEHECKISFHKETVSKIEQYYWMEFSEWE